MLRQNHIVLDVAVKCHVPTFGSQMSGRIFSSNNYRYGFNGQEKDDEVSGSGNSNTAEFWQYDTRLGRRWNIDPVRKPWQSDYSCLSNNPIWMVDPNGDDDYFNKDGSFSHSTKNGSKIYIASNAGNVTLSQYEVNDKVHQIARNRVVQHYSNQIGIKGGVGSYKTPSSGIPGFYRDKDNRAYVNQNGGINPMLDDSENLKNLFAHEKAHQKTGFGNEGFEHAKVYLLSFQDPSYKGAKNQDQLDWASGQLNGAAQFLNDHIDVIPSEVDNIASEFNKLSDKTGHKLIKKAYRAESDNGQQIVKYKYEVQPTKKAKK